MADNEEIAATYSGRTDATKIYKVPKKVETNERVNDRNRNRIRVYKHISILYSILTFYLFYFLGAIFYLYVPLFYSQLAEFMFSCK